jgi:hypothetical protein
VIGTKVDKTKIIFDSDAAKVIRRDAAWRDPLIRQMMRPYLYTYVCHSHLSVITADNQFSTILLADLILTGMIAYGLWRSKTGWKDTDAMIKRIIMQAPLSSYNRYKADLSQFQLRSSTYAYYHGSGDVDSVCYQLQLVHQFLLHVRPLRLLLDLR